LSAGIKEPNDLSGDRIATAQIRAFMEIAAMTAPTPVGRRIASAVLLRREVFNVKTSGRHRGVRNMAILTPAPGPLAHALPQASHAGVATRFNKARAFACKIAIKSKAWT
jgi:hypothetical protein